MSDTRSGSRAACGDRSGIPTDLALDVEAPTAADVFCRGGGWEGVLAAAEAPSDRLATARSPEYLRWRYAEAPALDYRVLMDEAGGLAPGVAVFRLRARGPLWEATVAELLVQPGDEGSARRLLRDVARVADVDHVTVSFPRGSAAARGARLAGALPAPVGPTMVANVLHDSRPDPRSGSSWALSLGDVEVF